MSDLSIHVPSVSETPSDFRIQTTAEWWQRAHLLPAEVGIRLLEPFALQLEGYRLGRRLLFRGELGGCVELRCAACNEPFVYRHREPVELLLEPLPAGEAPPEGGLALDADDPSLGRYAGEDLDFEPVLIESLLLSWPMHQRCTEACRGLCPECGCNRNRESCECGGGAESHPFERLRSLLPRPRGGAGD
jgi:uncharacterized protein